MKSYTKKTRKDHGNDLKSYSSKKHDANLKKNGLLHFQIGLIVSLLTTHLLMEMVFPVLNEDNTAYTIEEYSIEEVDIPNFVPYEEPIPEELPKDTEPPTVLGPDYDVVDNTTTKEVTKDIVVEPNPDPTPLNVKDINYDNPPIDVGPVPFIKVEKVPVFPGCESLNTNEEKRECMSDKINAIVRKHFKTNLAEVYGLQGMQRIDVQFKIDKKGQVGEIKVRAPHPALEKEAKRVIHMIPKMEPGKQRDQEVEVIFVKPILFRVQ